MRGKRRPYMAKRAAFQEKQYAFAAHIRDPEHVPAPEGVEDRRMAIYRELFFNNLRSLLSSTFPVLKKLHSDEKWRRMVRQFMQKHESHTPYFLRLPEEFLNFLRDEYETQDDDYAFLLELAHYEYIELALSISTDANDMTGVDPDGDLLNGVPVKSVLTWVYAYEYPVHRISAEYLPDSPLEQPVNLAVYRRANDEVGFLELNPMSANLLHLVEDNSAADSGEVLLRKLAADTNYADVDAFVEHGATALEEMRGLEILTGTRTVNDRS